MRRTTPRATRLLPAALPAALLTAALTAAPPAALAAPSATAGVPAPTGTAVAAAPTTYRVVAGDTLTAIGAKTGVAWRTIAALNNLKAPYEIHVGQVLKLTGVARSNSVVETRRIGTSVKGRALTAYRKGNPEATTRLLVLGQMHGNETAGPKTARHLIDNVPVALDLDVWIIPTINPDGAVAGTRTNARKVDINRNFPNNWKKQNVGKPTYSGPSAASEPETKALKAFLDQVQPDFIASIHQPFGGVGTTEKDPTFVRRLATNLGLPVESYNCSGVCRGSMTGWYNDTHEGVAVTIEYSPSPSATFVQKAASGILKSVVLKGATSS